MSMYLYYMHVNVERVWCTTDYPSTATLSSPALHYFPSNHVVDAAPEDIHAGKEGPILELFWQIIRRYQLQWSPCGIPDKLALYTWLGERMPHHKINNFDSG